MGWLRRPQAPESARIITRARRQVKPAPDGQAEAASGAREVPATGEYGRIGKDNCRPIEGARRPFSHRESCVRSGDPTGRLAGRAAIEAAKGKEGVAGGPVLEDARRGAFARAIQVSLVRSAQSFTELCHLHTVSGHGCFREVS